jgi:hypothetical protein
MDNRVAKRQVKMSELKTPPSRRQAIIDRHPALNVDRVWGTAAGYRSDTKLSNNPAAQTCTCLFKWNAEKIRSAWGDLDWWEKRQISGVSGAVCCCALSRQDSKCALYRKFRLQEIGLRVQTGMSNSTLWRRWTARLLSSAPDAV